MINVSIESDFHPLGAIAFAEARGQVSPDAKSDEVLVPTESLEADPPGWPQDPDNPRPGRIGSARFGFTEESGSVKGSSSNFGFMESSSPGPTLV